MAKEDVTRGIGEAVDSAGAALSGLAKADEDRRALANEIGEYLHQKHLFGDKEWFGDWEDFTLNQVNYDEGHTVTVTKGGKKYKLRAGEKFADWKRNGKPVPGAPAPAPPAAPTPAPAPPAAPTPAPAPPAAPTPAPSDPEPTSRLRGTLAGETAAPTTKPIQMDMYHGGFGLDEGLVDPAKHSSARTPLPALTVSDEAVARRYATTGGPIGGFAGGSTYKLGLEFDSPERIVQAFDPASDDFISFMRNSLPEEGVRAPLVPGGKPRCCSI